MIVILFSLVLAQVKDFLPRLALSNQHLKEAVENGENVNIENVGDTHGPLIQMVCPFNLLYSPIIFIWQGVSLTSQLY